MSFTHSYIYRGIAALIIMLQHVAGSFKIRYLTPLGGIGVAMFLISSGYGLNESFIKKSGEKYWKNKLLKIFIPYAILETILIPCYGKFSISSYLLDITCISPHYWYLQYQLLCYIVFYLLIKIPKAYNYRYIVLAFFSVGTFLFGTSLQAEQAISFIIGVWISDNKIKAKEKSNNFMFCGTMVVIGIVFLIIKQLPMLRTFEGGFIWYSIQLMMKISLAVFLICISYKGYKIFSNKFMVFMGGISFEFYLIHMKFLWLLNSKINAEVAMIIF